MTLEIVGLIILIMLCVGTTPKWPWSRTWGYSFSGLVGLIAVVFLVLLVAGKPHL